MEENMPNTLDIVFENREDLYKKVIDLYTLLLSIKVVDVVMDVTNIKQDLEYDIVVNNIEEKVSYYIDNLKYKLSYIYPKFGIVIEPSSSLDTFTLVARLINDLEVKDKDELEFLNNLLVDDGNLEEKFYQLLIELYPIENNTEHMENLDISEYFLEEIVVNIFTLKKQMDTTNIELINSMVRLLTNSLVKETLTFKEVMSGELNIVLDLKEDQELVLSIIDEHIKKYLINEVSLDIIVTDIYVTLKLYGDDISYYINSEILNNTIKGLDVTYIKDMLNRLEGER